MPTPHGEGPSSAVHRLVLPVRVYFEDTDAGGVVYHAAFLRFMERARTEWLRALGFEHGGQGLGDSLGFVVQAMELRFHKPARLNDSLQVSAALESVGNCRSVFAQTVERADEVLVDARVTLACLELRSFNPVRIPKAIRQKMQE